MAKLLLANPDLPKLLREGWPEPPEPCSYCNRCLLNVIEHPLGCYDERRFKSYGAKSYEKMIETIMEQFPDKTNAPTSCGWLL
jgi:hypothetical protein